MAPKGRAMAEATTPEDGWPESKKLVTHRLNELTKAVEGLRKDFKENHTPPCAEILEVDRKVTKLEAGQGKLETSQSLIRWVVGCLLFGMFGLIVSLIVMVKNGGP